MTTRERMEARLERRRQWAISRDRQATAGFARARAIADRIPLGQPLLIGHHSYKRALKDQQRISAGMAAGCESHAMAETHRSKAAGIEAQLDRSIFSDDDNAIEALEARIAENEAKRDRKKLVNKLYKKGDAAGLAVLGVDMAKLKADLVKAGAYFGKAPHMPYEMTNLGARIRADKERIEQIRKRQRRMEATAEAGGILITGGEYVTVTFADKPERSVIDALKAAGFSWGAGSWYGQRAKLPAEVEA